MFAEAEARLVRPLIQALRLIEAQLVALEPGTEGFALVELSRMRVAAAAQYVIEELKAEQDRKASESDTDPAPAPDPAESIA